MYLYYEEDNAPESSQCSRKCLQQLADHSSPYFHSHALKVLFNFCMHLRFPLGEDLLESTPYLVLAILPSLVLLPESSSEAQLRDQRLQSCAVEFLRKT